MIKYLQMAVAKGRSVKQSAKAAVGTVVMTATVSAHAALPAEATAAFTTISGNVSDIFAAAWPIIGSVTGGFVLISLFKRGASKL